MGQIKEYIKIAIRSLKTRPMRSWLTMIGVVIGVFLIMSLLSLSEGIKTAMLQQLRMMGKDLVMIMPGEITDIATMMAGGMELNEDDLKAVKKADGVDVVVPMTYKGEAVRYKGEKKTVILSGYPWKEGLDVLRDDWGLSLTEGRWPTPGKREILVGNLVPKEVFPKMKTGTEITIKGRQLKVVGVLRSVGTKQDDSQLLVDLDIFREITGERTGAKMAFAKVEAGYSTDRAIENIKESLDETRKRRRGEDFPSYTVLSSEKMTDIISNIMALVQIAIFAFASIAIIVGAIGIMNTMYTSVHERIREIGIMKAVGAKNKNIITIFLVEAGFFGLFGGLGGIILGLGLAKIIELYFQIHPVFFFKASITPQLILFGLVFSFLIGCISGFLPARSASKLKPVDALRYE
ncbi:ABC transporter permease [Patescibacteria group bacterium AH-259-L05]|nr:ABC transporter permease [Patescibacteria group bacterium AH-259-L05]